LGNWEKILCKFNYEKILYYCLLHPAPLTQECLLIALKHRGWKRVFFCHTYHPLSCQTNHLGSNTILYFTKNILDIWIQHVRLIQKTSIALRYGIIIMDLLWKALSCFSYTTFHSRSTGTNWIFSFFTSNSRRKHSVSVIFPIHKN